MSRPLASFQLVQRIALCPNLYSVSVSFLQIQSCHRGLFSSAWHWHPSTGGPDRDWGAGQCHSKMYHFLKNIPLSDFPDMAAALTVAHCIVKSLLCSKELMFVCEKLGWACVDKALSCWIFSGSSNVGNKPWSRLPLWGRVPRAFVDVIMSIALWIWWHCS